MPNMMGSLGRLTPIPPVSSSRLTVNGVRNTTKRTNLSKETKATSDTSIAAGTRLK